MRRPLWLAGLSAVILLAATPAYAATSIPASRINRGHLVAAAEAVVAAGAPGATVLVRSGPTVRAVSAGLADRDAGVAMKPRDHIRAGSVTKSFVAVVALQLVTERRLRLTDRLDAWLPGVLPYGHTVTVQQLLNHTSGVPEYLGIVTQTYTAGPASWLRHWDPADLVALVKDTPAVFPAGAGWQYSNTDYILLGMIIERATGRTLSHEIDQRIVRPLDLDDTSLPVDTTTLPAPAARGYLDVSAPDGRPLDVTDWNPSAAWAAGALVSTVGDLATFYRALLGGGLLAPAQLRQMLTTVDVGSFAYGLGIFVLQTPCGLAIGHNGAIFGYGVDAFTSRDGSRQVVLANNMYLGAALATQESLIGTLFCR